MSDFNPKATKNRRQKDRKKRKKLRAKLEAAGYAEDVIESIIDQRREEDRARRNGSNTDTLRYDPENDQGYYPDDTGYEPSLGDPLLRGAARATGVTAKVVKRRETITDWQYPRFLPDEDSA